MAAQWYYEKNGQQLGPVPENQIQGLIQSGQLRSADLVWREGMTDWMSLGSVPELAQLLPPSALAPAGRRPPAPREDDEEEDYPRRRRRAPEDEDEEDDYDRPRPKKRRRVSSGELTWLDEQFRNTSWVLLILFPICCGYIALVFSILGVIICKDPEAKQKALVVLCISVVGSILGTIALIVRASMGKF